MTSDGIVMTSDHGSMRLTNFTARIAAELRYDDGVETRKALELEVKLGERIGHVTVSPEKLFSDVRRWPIEAVGSAAIVYPVQKATEHVVVAIQLSSHEPGLGVDERTIYEHTGWTGSNDALAFLHAGGAIGAVGSLPGVEVSLRDPLGSFSLPQPASGALLASAVRSSLALLEVAPDRVTVPLLCAVARAPLGSSDFSMFLVGGTGNLKSELAARAQQHFGAEFDREHLPCNWQSTANAIKEIGFLAKDTLLVIDDFKPQGNRYGIDQAHKVAEDVLRAQGNHSARQRLDRSSNLRPDRRPRCLILATGEDLPRVESARARMVVVDVEKGDVDLDRMTSAQDAGARSNYAASMAGYVQRLATCRPDLDGLKAKIEADFDTTDVAGVHLRTRPALIQLLTGLRCYLDYTLDVGACTGDEASTIFGRAKSALRELAVRQRDHQADENPARRYITTLAATIRRGDAHLADLKTGGPPGNPGLWGWRRANNGQWEPSGSTVGWLDESCAYVDREPSLAVVNRLAQEVSVPLELSSKALGKALAEAGLLQKAEEGRGNVYPENSSKRSAGRIVGDPDRRILGTSS